jgi:transposase
MAARRTYTLEFKREAVRMVTDRKLSIPEAARQLGINPNVLRKWRNALTGHPNRSTPEKKTQSALEEENRRLRAENERLRMERDILKKATVFFAKESR